MINYKNNTWNIQYMFDIPEPWFNYHQIMACNSILRVREIKQLFYNDKTLDKLIDFSVIVNIHSYAPLGIYIVHKDWVQSPFIDSDDFNEKFTIKRYLEERNNYPCTSDYDFLEELERFKESPYIKKYSYPYWMKEENQKELLLKTKWTIVTFEDKPIALISKYDSWRIPDQMYYHSELRDWEQEQEKNKYKSFRLKDLKE